MHRRWLLGALVPGAGALLYGTLRPSTRTPQSPFDYPELHAAIQQRQVTQQAVLRFVHAHQESLQDAHNAVAAASHSSWWTGGSQLRSAKRHLAELEADIQRGIEHLLFGTDAGRHRQYLDRYGCTEWTEEALQTLTQWGPLLEIGAGRGQWARELRKRNVDILAFDDMSNVPLPEQRFVTKVLRGDHSEVPRHPDRTLFLCYPPPGAMARQCLQLYQGRTLLYVGEGYRGVNADEHFFRMLDGAWDCAEAVELKPFPGGCERLWVLKRRKGAV